MSLTIQSVVAYLKAMAEIYSTVWKGMKKTKNVPMETTFVDALPLTQNQ